MSQDSADFCQSWKDVADGAERPSRNHGIEAVVCEWQPTTGIPVYCGDRDRSTGNPPFHLSRAHDLTVNRSHMRHADRIVQEVVPGTKTDFQNVSLGGSECQPTLLIDMMSSHQMVYYAWENKPGIEAHSVCPLSRTVLLGFHRNEIHSTR
jgi:hypothetical protein